MKGLTKKLLVAALVAPLLSSCFDNEGNSYAGFSQVQTSATAYANNTVGRLAFMSYGDWTLTLTSGSDWLTPKTTKGQGMAIYSIAVDIKMNTTGSARTARLYLEDTSGDANMSFGMGQYATRGDGSMGSAPLVSTITGDDGSLVDISYDNLCRPTAVSIKKGETLYRNLTLQWADSTLTVGGMSASLNSGYQPSALTSQTDTVGLFSQSYLPTGENQAFNFIESKNNGSEYAAQGILMIGQSLTDPDGDRQIDSLRYIHHYANGTTVREFMKLSYAATDNRYQSVDANQLLLGAEECNPYLLLGLFRSARSTKMISSAATSDGTFKVETTLNSDKSINTMTVTDKQGNKTTYTFAYHPDSLWQ